MIAQHVRAATVQKMRVCCLLVVFVVGAWQLLEKHTQMSETVKERKARHSSLRETLIVELGGTDVVARTKCKYQNVTLKQLVRMKFQSAVSAPSKASFATLLATRVAKSYRTADDGVYVHFPVSSAYVCVACTRHECAS